MIPPALIVVRWSWLWLPFPLFLLWPFLILLWLVVASTLTLVWLMLRAQAPRSVEAGESVLAVIWWQSWRLFCGWGGTRVTIVQSGFHMEVKVI